MVEANNMSAMSSTGSANGYGNAFQQPNITFMNMPTNTDGVSQPITAGRLTISVYLTLWVKLTTADEIALYDRQIRLWGVKAQEK
jgi:hypothetical protein